MIWLLSYVAIFAISCWLLYNTLVDPPRHVASKKEPVADFEYSKHPEVAERLAKAITFKTISHASDNIEVEELAKMVKYLEGQFPLAFGGHELVTVEKINEYSRLLTIRGSDPSLKGFLMNAHMDVVPTEGQKWSSDPFNTGIRDGVIFGRGAVDDKGSVLSILEAVSYLLRSGFKPKRTIYIALCHDEEVSGLGGAKAITDLLISRKVQLEFVHDEGTMIFKELFPGVKKDIALVGVTEKGYVDVEVSMNTVLDAGHSSAARPGVGVLGKLGIVAHAAEKRQMTMYLNDATVEMFRLIASETNFIGRLILRNIRLFWPIFHRVIGRTYLHALFRTTSTVTMFNGGLKQNVVPSSGSFIINHRIHPEENVAKVMERDQSLLIDPHMQVTAQRPAEPHPVAPFDETAIGYHSIKAAVEQSIGPEKVLVVPGLMIAASDSRHYCRITTACYRFLPTRIRVKEAHRYHGHDELITIENFEETINFYVNLIRNANSTSVEDIYRKNEPKLNRESR